MNVVVHQPYFLPWIGYFSKLFYADKFIVLDDVNYPAHQLINRTKIINPQGEVMWVTLPIGEHIYTKIKDINLASLPYKEIDKHRERDKINRTLKSSYSKARFFKSNITAIENILTDSFNNSDLLSEINVSIIVHIMNLLELKTPQIIYSSQFQTTNDATDRIISLCKKNQCDTLITGSGGLEKHDWDKMSDNEINTCVQYYYENHPTYYQTRRTQLGFERALSIVDCIFNEGIEYTKSLITDVKYKPVIYKQAKLLI